MALSAVLVVLPIGTLFLLSGFIINFFQAFFFILVRPVSKNTYRRINKVIAELLWLELIWLIDWWAGIKSSIILIKMHTDLETSQLLGKEHALVICNHRSDIDWLIGWVLTQRAGCLGSALAIMKREVKILPIIGWSMWFCGYIFLERRWTNDESTLKSGFRQLEDFPVPFWMALFVEGTRFTQHNLALAQEFAASIGLPVPRNVLIPRTKDFVAAVSHMRSFVPAIYDCTIAIPKNQPPPTMLRLFRGQTSVVQIRRHLMSELPETDDGVSQWCKDVFVTKLQIFPRHRDALLEKYFNKGSFSELQQEDIGRPKKSLLVFISWFCLIVLGIVEFARRSTLLSTWEGIAIALAFLFLVIIILQILVRSSESERSTPAKLSLEDLIKKSLIQ